MINSDLIATVQRRLDDPNGTDFDTPSVLRELNACARELSNIPSVKRYLLPKEDTTTLTITLNGSYGNTSYALPSDYNYMVERVLYDSTSANPVQLTPLHLDELQSQFISNGQHVDGFAVRGTTLYLNGTPPAADVGKIVKLWYSKDPVAITNDVTETTLGKLCPNLLIDYASANLALSDDELTGVADRWLSQYREGKQEFIESLEDGGLAYGQHILDEWGE